MPEVFWKKAISALGVGAAVAAGFVGVTSLTDRTTEAVDAKAPGEALAAGTPLSFHEMSSSFPRNIRDGVLRVAVNAGVDEASLRIAGTDVDTGGRQSVVIGNDASGRSQVAFVASSSYTQFVSPERLFAPGDVLYFGYTHSGTPTELAHATVYGLVRPHVTRVTLQRPDGTTHTVPLVRWPSAPYASFAEVANDKSQIPTTLRAYDADGDLVEERPTSIGPLCLPANPDCID